MEIKAPEPTPTLFYPEGPLRIFLAGSIEMGKAEKWQDRIVAALEGYDCILLNPRRDDWDSSWVQDPTEGTKFHEQVNWELENIVESDLIVFYFDPNTQSPITLLELGLVIGLNMNAIICCPDGYFRKGNIVITASGYEITNTFEKLVEQIKIYISSAY